MNDDHENIQGNDWHMVYQLVRNNQSVISNNNERFTQNQHLFQPRLPSSATRLSSCWVRTKYFSIWVESRPVCLKHPECSWCRECIRVIRVPCNFYIPLSDLKQKENTVDYEEFQTEMHRDSEPLEIRMLVLGHSRPHNSPWALLLQY